MYSNSLLLRVISYVYDIRRTISAVKEKYNKLHILCYSSQQSKTLGIIENYFPIKMIKKKIHFFTQSIWTDKLSELVFLIQNESPIDCRIRKSSLNFLTLNDLLIHVFWQYQIKTCNIAFIMRIQIFLFLILTFPSKFIAVLIFL